MEELERLKNSICGERNMNVDSCRFFCFLISMELDFAKRPALKGKVCSTTMLEGILGIKGYVAGSTFECKPIIK
jgi:hypothetical protein